MKVIQYKRPPGRIFKHTTQERADFEAMSFAERIGNVRAALVGRQLDPERFNILGFEVEGYNLYVPFKKNND